jgi:hypothetical protein
VLVRALDTALHQHVVALSVIKDGVCRSGWHLADWEVEPATTTAVAEQGHGDKEATLIMTESSSTWCTDQAGRDCPYVQQ